VEERIDIGGASLRVRSEGEGIRSESGRPTLLCLHGLVDTLEIWDRVAPQLAGGRRLVRYDQRGHGESGAPPGPYARADMAGDAIRVLDGLGIDRAVLVGHSMGGIVSMAAALAHPDRVAGLVLIGTASRCNEKIAQWYERIAQAGESDGNEGLARRIYGRESNKQVKGDAQGIAHVTRMLGSLYDDPLTPKLAAIGCPVLLLVGEQDPMGPKASATIADALVDGRLEVVPECGHWIHIDEPEILVAAFERWAGERSLA